jgi:hypothetical protein
LGAAIELPAPEVAIAADTTHQHPTCQAHQGEEYDSGREAEHNRLHAAIGVWGKRREDEASQHHDAGHGGKEHELYAGSLRQPPTGHGSSIRRVTLHIFLRE